MYMAHHNHPDPPMIIKPASSPALWPDAQVFCLYPYVFRKVLKLGSSKGKGNIADPNGSMNLSLYIYIGSGSPIAYRISADPEGHAVSREARAGPDDDYIPDYIKYEVRPKDQGKIFCVFPCFSKSRYNKGTGS